jgi:hypothetical protein
MFKCDACDHVLKSKQKLWFHILSDHDHKKDEEFGKTLACVHDSCDYSIDLKADDPKKTFQRHCSRRHSRASTQTVEHNLSELDIFEKQSPGNGKDVADIGVAEPVENLDECRFAVARALLDLETNHNCTAKAIDATVTHWKLVMDLSIGDSSKVASILKPFQTEHLRSKFYRDRCNLTRPVLNDLKEQASEPSEAYYVPFLQQIKDILQLPEMKNYMSKPRLPSDTYMRDVRDGEYFKTNPYFKENPNALAIMFNIDDVCMANALGPRQKKHKLTVAYFTIANIPVEHRSKISSIFLVAIGNSKYVTGMGLDTFLDDFISSMNKLSEGVEIEGIGEVKGRLIFTSNDDLAAQELAGLKRGAGTAHKFCRSCEITHGELQEGSWVENPVALRTHAGIASGATVVEKFQNGNKEKKYCAYWSKSWGINQNSAFNMLAGFDLPTQMLHDPMHVLLEGEFNRQTAQFLEEAIYSDKSNQLFDLQWLNKQLKEYNYSHLDKANKPQPIERDHLKKQNKLKQTAATILLLAYILPHIIGQKFILLKGRNAQMRKKYSNYLNLIKIVLLSTAPIATADTADELQLLVSQYLLKVKELDPSARYIPKCHYMTHLAQQIRNFGPGRGQWVMRYEAKHNELKRKKMTNFIFPSKTLSGRVQRRQCYNMLGVDGGRNPNFFSGHPENVKFTVHKFSEFKEEFQATLRAKYESEGIEGTFSKLKDVEINSRCYKKDDFLLLDDTDAQPVFGQIESIFHRVGESSSDFFVVNNWKTTAGCLMLNSWQVERDPEQSQLVWLCDLDNTWSLPCFVHNTKTYVTNRYSHRQHLA